MTAKKNTTPSTEFQPIEVNVGDTTPPIVTEVNVGSESTPAATPAKQKENS